MSDQADAVALFLLCNLDNPLPEPMFGKWSDGPVNFMGQAAEIFAPATHYRHIVLREHLEASALRPGRIRYSR